MASLEASSPDVGKIKWQITGLDRAFNTANFECAGIATEPAKNDQKPTSGILDEETPTQASGGLNQTGTYTVGGLNYTTYKIYGYVKLRNGPCWGANTATVTVMAPEQKKPGWPGDFNGWDSVGGYEGEEMNASAKEWNEFINLCISARKEIKKYCDSSISSWDSQLYPAVGGSAMSYRQANEAISILDGITSRTLPNTVGEGDYIRITFFENLRLAYMRLKTDYDWK